MSLPNVSKEKLRLDELLVRRGFFVSRSRSRDAIARGAVTVAGKVITKPGQVTPDDAEIVVDDPARLYVSRAALKLIAGLDAFKLDSKGATALDIGASTGGFTQVLLERGAAHVYAVDVGHGQIDEGLAGDERVTNLEKLNARELCAEHLGGVAPDFVVSDVSFISLKLALPPALTLARPGAHCVLLVKPQFEAGRAAIGKGGILKDPSMGPQIADDLAAWLETQSGWRSLGIAPSPIEGGDGNNEFLLGGVKDK